MNIAFRVDASVKMGIGHVLRSLTLSNFLLKRGVSSYFICRELPENLRLQIETFGHSVHILNPAPLNNSNLKTGIESSIESKWLNVAQLVDAEETLDALGQLPPANWSWVIVDQYGIDREWENMIVPYCDKLMVIDDLANRVHSCDVLLDQGLDRKAKDYESLVPPSCDIIVGPKYALLRPEFAQFRAYSLNRRKEISLGRLLISLGGTDPNNITKKVLDILIGHKLVDGIDVTVVAGSNSLFLDTIQTQIDEANENIRLLVDVVNMAELMSECDLMIGAGGMSSWERCCLGIPALVIVLAENQLGNAKALNQSGAVINLGCGESETLEKKLMHFLLSFEELPSKLAAMQSSASKLTDGKGASHIADKIFE